LSSSPWRRWYWRSASRGTFSRQETAGRFWKNPHRKKKVNYLDAGLLEKSAYLEGRKEIARTEEKLSLLQKELYEIKEEKAKAVHAGSKQPLQRSEAGRSIKSDLLPRSALPPPPVSLPGPSKVGQGAQAAAETTGDIETRLESAGAETGSEGPPR
jgi:hypothetical protein